MERYDIKYTIRRIGQPIWKEEKHHEIVEDMGGYEAKLYIFNREIKRGDVANISFQEVKLLI